jgi:threonine/homoserine/homoserine lactone efflux protein
MFKMMGEKMAAAKDVNEMRAVMIESPAPEGVTCTPVEAGGVSAEWSVAAGAAEDKVIVYVHGGGYLIYLGIRTIVARHAAAGVGVPAPRSLSRVFTDGIVVSIFNPKIAVFFLAFLPQFVNPSRGSVHYQILFLGLLYNVLAIITDSGYALLAGRLRRWVGGRAVEGRLPRYAGGAVYIGLGVGTALVDRH